MEIDANNIDAFPEGEKHNFDHFFEISKYMTNIYRSEKEIELDILKKVPRDVIERDLLIDFLKQIPLDELKKIVEFKEVNPENPEHWGNEGTNHLLNQLRFNGTAKFYCRLITKKY